MESAASKLLQASSLISQGAEAKIYQGTITTNGEPILFKHRFKKTYRHPSLDASLTKSRIAGEARSLLKCLRSGVNVPGIRMVDANEGLLGIEWIDGDTVKNVLLAASSTENLSEACSDRVDGDGGNPLDKKLVSPSKALMDLIGTEIARMHLADVIHGDLTTSNMMLRRSRSLDNADTRAPAELVLIDFGLSYVSTLVEDKAVDLYVLERAFASTHPDSEPLFAAILAAYARVLEKEWPALQRRLDEVRLRGRKRSMVG